MTRREQTTGDDGYVVGSDVRFVAPRSHRALIELLDVAIASAIDLGDIHRNGRVHGDVRPAAWRRQSDGVLRLTPPEPHAGKLTQHERLQRGRLAYAAPECVGGAQRPPDRRSDLYALGAVIYEMLTGEPPFAAVDAMELIHAHSARIPRSPSQLNPVTPAAVDGIVLKLLAKSAAARYQTAAGLEHDLRRCRDMLRVRGSIDPFELASRDRPERPSVPDELYGRGGPMAEIRAALDRVARGGETELVVIQGHAGVGKTALVSAFQASIPPGGALFAGGKADQYLRAAPYAALAIAIQGLVRAMLSAPQGELLRFRAALSEALGENGRLIVDLAPDLSLIIGELPPVEALRPQDEKVRFQGVLKAFFGVLGQPSRPVVLFLDDLQWLDLAALGAIEALLADRDIRNLLVIGAYRANEVDAGHPLSLALSSVADGGTHIGRLVLEGLSEPDLRDMIAESLGSDPTACAPLVELLRVKTDGNPFFVRQLLDGLAADGLLSFESAAAAWIWDPDALRSAAISDNVADLMAGKLKRLPTPTLEAISLLSCIGARATSRTLSWVLRASEPAVAAKLAPALEDGLIKRTSDTYAFSHDRVHEASYALVPLAQRPAAHLAVGRGILSAASDAEVTERLFEIVEHLHRGVDLMASSDERVRFAELQLMAGRRARASTAYQAARGYVEAGLSALGPDAIAAHPRLAFDLEFLLAECEFLAGDLGAAEARLSALHPRARDDLDVAAVTSSQLAVYAALGEWHRGTGVGVAFLQGFGLDVPAAPSDLEVREACDRLSAVLKSYTIDEIREAPLVRDARWRACMDVIAELMPLASRLDLNLADMCTLLLVELSLKHGHASGSPFAFASLNVFPMRGVGDLESIVPYAELAIDLADRPGLGRLKARALVCVAIFVLPWTRPYVVARRQLVRAVHVAHEIVDQAFAQYGARYLSINLLVSGQPLATVQARIEIGLASALKAGFGEIADTLFWQLILVWDLRGRPRARSSLENEAFAGPWFDERLETHAEMQRAPNTYWIHRLQARYLADDIEGALDAAGRANRNLRPLYTHLEFNDYTLYSALVRAAACRSTTGEGLREHLAAIRDHGRQFAVWSARCPENFAAREAMIAGEIARLEGRGADAERLYETAILAARTHGLPNDEALASDLAAAFHSARGMATVAEGYVRNAWSAYLRWGADARARALEARHPYLADTQAGLRSGSSASDEISPLDVAAITRMSQAVSGELILNVLVERLMTIVLEHAGAERGLLFLPTGVDMHVVAEAVTEQDMVTVRHAEAGRGDHPSTVVNYVARARRSVVLDDALVATPFAADPYVLSERPRSVLCLPLTKQGRLIGLLYLENTLSADVFTPERASLLNIIAGQAAISLENARLYEDLDRSQQQARRAEQDLRRSFDMIPALAWTADADGTPEFANRQWYEYVGRPAGTFRDADWLSTFHASDRTKVRQVWQDLLATGVAGEIEARMLRWDGVARSFLVRATPMHDEEGAIAKWIGVNTDIEALKRAEHALEALARAGRLTAMGELTISIAHEVNQPLMAIVTNAASCLQWLTDGRVDVAEARAAAERIVRDGHRAGEIITRIRNLARKSPPTLAPMQISEAVSEILTLLKVEMDRRDIRVETVFAPNLERVDGDRVRLQQVILNLVMNAAEAIEAELDQPRRLIVRTHRARGGGVQVSVADTGHGLAPGGAERIFDAFYTTKAEGLGMGLSICRSIVEAHGGRLWATPNGPRGSIFHFTIPAATHVGVREL